MFHLMLHAHALVFYRLVCHDARNMYAVAASGTTANDVPDQAPRQKPAMHCKA